MIEEARLEDVGSGLAPVSEGWFVVNARDAAWLTNDTFGGVCIFESDHHVLRKRPDLQPVQVEGAGFTVRVMQPGQASGLYHAESKEQEDFLVVAGECVVLIEEQERQLRTWDVVRCPPGTRHTFVGTGDDPCVIVAVGNRVEGSASVYPRSELALKYGASVEEDNPKSPHAAYGPWEHKHPELWNELPWSS